MCTPMVTEQDVRDVMEGGNGSVKFLPAADGETWQLTYYKGKLRVDKFEKGATIPLSARRVGGSAIPIASDT